MSVFKCQIKPRKIPTLCVPKTQIIYTILLTPAAMARSHSSTPQQRRDSLGGGAVEKTAATESKLEPDHDDRNDDVQQQQRDEDDASAAATNTIADDSGDMDEVTFFPLVFFTKIFIIENNSI